MPVSFVCAAAAASFWGVSFLPVGARVLLGASAAKGTGCRAPRISARDRVLLWAWKAGDGWFVLVDASSELNSSFFHASVSYRPLALIFLKNKDALDKRVALNSVHAQRAQPFPDSSTQHW